MPMHAEHGTPLEKTQTSYRTNFQGAGDEPPDIDARRKFAKQTEEYFLYYQGALQKTFERVKRHWELFLGRGKDTRKVYEKWRAFLHLPHGYSAVEVANASVLDLILSEKVPIQAEAVPGAGAEELADKLTAYWDYVLRSIRFPREMDMYLRELRVQGLAIRKNVFIEKKREIVYIPSDEQAELYDSEVKRAIEAGAPPPPLPGKFPDNQEFQKAFEKWRQILVSAGLNIPELPLPGRKTVVHYRGPGWKPVSYFSYFYDPNVRHEEQVCVIQQSIVPEEWVLQRTGPGPGFAFDPEAVEEGIGGGALTQTAVNEWVESLSQFFGVQQGNMLSPQYRNKSEVLECYMPNDRQCPFRMVLNRRVTINKRKDIPYRHGDHPYTVGENILIPFTSTSIGEFSQVEGLMKEGATLRGLRIDGTYGSVLPIFAKLKAAGLTELQRRYSPGLVIETAAGPKALQQVSNVNVPDAAFREISEIKQEIDDTIGSTAVLRGAIGPSHTTASAQERAGRQAAIRQLVQVFRLEGDLTRTVEQWLWLSFQFFKPDELRELGGHVNIDPMVTFKSEDFLQALNMKYAFRSARNTVNKELQIQQLKDVLVTLVNAQLPDFKPSVVARRLLEKVDPGLGGDAWKSQEEMQQEQAEAKAVADAAAAGGGGAPPGAAPPGAPPGAPPAPPPG